MSANRQGRRNPEYKKRHNRINYERKKKNGYHAQSNLDRAKSKILNGIQIKHKASHHKAMSSILSDRGIHRPEGLTLSRICPDNCESIYAGLHGGHNYSLCLNPDHYIYESIKDNLARGQIVWHTG